MPTKEKPYTTPDPLAFAQALRGVYERAAPLFQKIWENAEQEITNHPLDFKKMGENTRRICKVR